MCHFSGSYIVKSMKDWRNRKTTTDPVKLLTPLTSYWSYNVPMASSTSQRPGQEGPLWPSPAAEAHLDSTSSLFPSTSYLAGPLCSGWTFPEHPAGSPGKPSWVQHCYKPIVCGAPRTLHTRGVFMQGLSHLTSNPLLPPKIPFYYYNSKQWTLKHDRMFVKH